LVVGPLVDVLGHDRGAGRQEGVEEGLKGLLQLELHRVVVERPDALAQLECYPRPRMDLREKVEGGEYDVIGSEGLAVVPEDVVLQVKRIG